MTRVTASRALWLRIGRVARRLSGLLASIDTDGLSEGHREIVADWAEDLAELANDLRRVAGAERLDQTGPKTAQVDDSKLMRRD